jgi:hypothetical protein
MKTIINLFGGLAGALALNGLHQAYQLVDHDAPRVDLVGEEALTKIMESAGAIPLKGNALFAATMAADVLSNAFYYSIIGIGKKENVIVRGAMYGLAAGIGALTLTKPLGLSDAPVTRTDKTKVLTVAWYLIGGVVTSLTLKALRK